jgi:hypothetical protein
MAVRTLSADPRDVRDCDRARGSGDAVGVGVLATFVVSATVQAGNHVRWLFDHAVTSDGLAAPELKVLAFAPTSTVQDGSNSVLCHYGPGVVAGQAWHVTGAVGHVAASPPIYYPQSGVLL